MEKLIARSLIILAVGGASISWLPFETKGAFAVGGVPADCDTQTRKPRTCGSIGAGTCTKKRQGCYQLAGSNLYICETEMGGASDCDGVEPCADEDHDSTDSNCKAT